MFDIGFAELLIIAVVALVVLGPDKLPVAARTVGLWLGRIRRTVSSIQSEISEELRIEEMKRTAAVSKETLNEELNDMRTPFVDSSRSSSTSNSASNSQTAQTDVAPSAETVKKQDNG